jgi:hypothetical protein
LNQASGMPSGLQTTMPRHRRPAREEDEMIGLRRLLRAAVVLLAPLAVSACVAGGANQPVNFGNPPPVSSKPALGTASLTFTAPRNGSAKLRAPRAGTAAKLVVTIVSVDGSATLPSGVTAQTTVPLSSAAGGNCTVAPATGESCTVTIPTLPGHAVGYTFQVQDEAGNVLAVASATFTIPATGSPSFTATLPPVVTLATVASPQFTAGSASSTPLQISYSDATSATIVGQGPFANTVTITNNDTSGHTSLSLNGGAPAKSVTVTSSHDVVTINYDGAQVAPFTFSASESAPPGGFGANGGNCQSNCGGGGTADGTAADITFGGAAETSTIPGFPNTGKPTVFFAGAGSAYQPRTFTVMQGQNTKTFDVDAGACAGIATVSPPTDSSSFTVTAVAPGLCRLDVTVHGKSKDLNNPGQSASIWVSITAAAFNVD